MTLIGKPKDNTTKKGEARRALFLRGWFNWDTRIKRADGRTRTDDRSLTKRFSIRWH